MTRFENRTVLITGAAGGQGESHARGFHAEGANVVMADIHEDRGRGIASELGDRAHFVRLDVTSETEWSHAVEEAEDRFGALSVLVNNAGILPPAATIEDGDSSDWRRVIEVNLTGYYLGIRASVPSIRRAGGGAIVNISSTSGVEGTALIAPYVSSKWGIRGLTRTAALELGRDNIRVNAIAPGVVDTPMITEAAQPGESPISDSFPVDLFAVKRMGEPQDITNLVLFLASEDAAFITGSDYVSDGGLLLGPALAAGQAGH